MNRLIAAACALAACAGARADDPTRPPAEWLAPRTAAAAQPGTSGDALRLQAVLRTPGRPPGAMINGWVLRPGDTVQGVRLAAVGESHADVVVGTEKIRLSLTPSVRRTARDEAPSTPQAPARSPAGGKNSKGKS